MEKKAIALIIIVTILLSTAALTRLCVSYDNWREVARFSGTRTLGFTDPFNVTYSEWRIRWNIILDGSGGNFFSFIIRTGRRESVDSIFMEGSDATNGTLIVQSQNRTFFNEVQTDAKYWEVVIEENLDSPLVGSQKEIQYWFTVLILASIVLAVTLCIGLLVYFKKRKIGSMG